MAKLYGLTPTGQVVTKNAKIAYAAGLVRDGALVKCFRTVPEARDKARPGDVVIGFTRAPIRPGHRAIVVGWNGSIISNPACYVRGCTGGGGMVGVRWTGFTNEAVPACQKHAMKEVV
jgi:hypothetical protein